MTTNTTRRTLLRGIGILGLTGTTTSIAGCSGPSASDDSPTATAEPTETNDGGDSGDEFVETSTVDMTDDLTFEPKQIQVSAGTTVTWENVGSIGHTVTAYEDEIPDGADYFASGEFQSEDAAIEGYPSEGNIPEGETYEHTFETKGTYEYYCIPHELNGMVGTVKVT